MIIIKTDDQIELIRKSCLLVAETLSTVAQHITLGGNGESLDKIAEEFIRDHNAIPGFKGYGGFPATLCISINDQVVHGIPSDYEFQSGDILSIDCGVYMNGYYGDCAYTFILDGVSDDVLSLCRVTRKSLYKGIKAAVVGKRLGDIGNAIQHYTEKEHPYSVVRELVGHGIGENLHEEPQVPNYGKRGKGARLKSGLVIAIEPMINLGRKNVVKSRDGWTIHTKDGKPSAHYEHTIAVRNGVADILSDHKIIENQIKKNRNLVDISEKK